MTQQTYEEYWKLTNAFTDYNGKKFLDTLQVSVNFIDKYKNEDYSEKKYSRLQDDIHKVNRINHISIRKSINQLVKMGFINSFLVSYNLEVLEYLRASTDKKRKIILSKIIYSNSSFNRAVNKDSSIMQINFLIKTLTHKGSLSKEEIIALMLVDIESFNDSYISENDLQKYVKYAKSSGFLKRKYNQFGYLYNLLGKLNNLRLKNEILYFKEEADQIFGKDLKKIKKRRDNYLHSLYKNQLKEECEEIYGQSLCVLERLSYPSLIASHIKPFIVSDENEEYNPNNGLLLSRTVDSLFDLMYISFNDDGTILFSDRVSDDVKEFWKDYRIESVILNKERKKYLQYHRSQMNIAASI